MYSKIHSTSNANEHYGITTSRLMEWFEINKVEYLKNEAWLFHENKFLKFCLNAYIFRSFHWCMAYSRFQKRSRIQWDRLWCKLYCQVLVYSKLLDEISWYISRSSSFDGIGWYYSRSSLYFWRLCQYKTNLVVWLDKKNNTILTLETLSQ